MPVHVCNGHGISDINVCPSSDLVVCFDGSLKNMMWGLDIHPRLSGMFTSQWMVDCGRAEMSDAYISRDIHLSQGKAR